MDHGNNLQIFIYIYASVYMYIYIYIDQIFYPQTSPPIGLDYVDFVLPN